MKILFVLDHYYPYVGGAETLFRNTCESLARKGHKVQVVTTGLSQAKKFEKINNVLIYRIWTPPFSRRYWFTFLSLPKVFLLAKKADIIHTATYNAALSARLAGKILKKPNLISILEVLGDDWQELPGVSRLNAALHKFLERMVLKLNFDLYLCISQATRRNVLMFGIKKQKTKIIYPGINYRLFNPKNINPNFKQNFKESQTFTYLFFGRPGITKGVEYLIKAVPIIQKQMPKSRLLMILAREPKKRYKKILALIKKIDKSKRIKLIDPVRRELLPSYLSLADCIVVPSLTEGFGYSAAEACALKIPLVATTAGSLPEVVSGRFVLVKRKSSLSLADGILKIYRRQWRKSKLVKFTQEKSVKKLLKIYRKSLI